MKKIVLMVLGLLVVSVFLAGCAKEEVLASGEASEQYTDSELEVMKETPEGSALVGQAMGSQIMEGAVCVYKCIKMCKDPWGNAYCCKRSKCKE